MGAAQTLGQYQFRQDRINFRTVQLDKDAESTYYPPFPQYKYQP